MMEEFVSLTMVAMERKKDTFQLSLQWLLKGKILHQKNEPYKYILPLKK